MKNQNSKTEIQKEKPKDLISIRTVRRLKKELDSNIGDLLDEFYESTGIHVDNITIRSSDTFKGYRHLTSTEIKDLGR